MTTTNLQQWVLHPELLSRETLYELRNLVARYPYFQSLRLLYLKNLYLLHDINFGTELRKAVLYVADRRKLFELLEGELIADRGKQAGVSVEKAPADEPSVDRTLALIDAFLATTPDDFSTQTTLDYAVDYTAYLLEEPETADEAPADAPVEECPRLKGQSLIDSFIEKQESDIPRCLEKPEPSYGVEEATEEEAVDEEMDEETEEETEDKEQEEGYFTETLARIYIKQHRYSKALEIIKKLSLKYPKKNAYFADQIRFLEKLIINANSK
ncbi:MAG: tetratricopeptide repeat protein [Mediterranea sp.]|nr:tetratricopeptide repeat protein [Mediterranea sp.]